MLETKDKKIQLTRNKITPQRAILTSEKSFTNSHRINCSILFMLSPYLMSLEALLKYSSSKLIFFARISSIVK